MSDSLDFAEPKPPPAPKVIDRKPHHKMVGNRPLCTSDCPHNKNNHPSLAFSNKCQLNGEAISPCGGGPCWPAIEGIIEVLRERVISLL